MQYQHPTTTHTMENNNLPYNMQYQHPTRTHTMENNNLPYNMQYQHPTTTHTMAIWRTPWEMYPLLSETIKKRNTYILSNHGIINNYNISTI
jgi:hypothetical protein